MNLILFDDAWHREALKPIVLTEPVAEIRCGILTVREKWEKRLDVSSSALTEAYLSIKFPASYTDDNLYISSSLLPNEELVMSIKNLSPESGLAINNQLVAIRTSQKLNFGFELLEGIKIDNWTGESVVLEELTHLYLYNGSQIEVDFELLTHDLTSEKITDKGTVVYGEENIFVGKNVNIKAAVLNAEKGSIYIGDDAIIQEGAIIIGPVAIGKNAMVAYGAKIRPNTTLGPYCRVGGEVNNTVFHSYSNKAHEGFLGNSYVGAWCNFGANTNSSNLKNNYKSVSLYSYAQKKLVDTKQTYCGTFLGDYSKAGISTMFNTGTVAGVCCNIFGAGFQEKHIPSFSWGGNTHYDKYQFEKALEVINETMHHRDLELNQVDIDILKYISENY